MDEKDLSELKYKILLHAKLYVSTKSALNAIEKLVKLFQNEVDDDIKEALFITIINHYGRAFGDFKFKGNKKCYPLNNFKNHIGFNKTIHREIIQLRNKFISHGDWDAQNDQFGELRASFLNTNTNESTNLIVHVSVVIPQLIGTNFEKLISWKTHILNINEIAHKLVGTELEKLFIILNQYPHLQMTTRKNLVNEKVIFEAKLQANKAEIMPNFSSIPLDKELFLLPKSLIGDGYLYKLTPFIKQMMEGYVTNEKGEKIFRFEPINDFK